MTKTNFAAGQLRSFIDRVLRLKEEQDRLSADIREVYKEAHSVGFDKAQIGNVVTHLRKVEKQGEMRFEENASIFDLYLQTYCGEGGTVPAIAHTPAPAMPAHDPVTGEIAA